MTGTRIRALCLGVSLALGAAACEDAATPTAPSATSPVTATFASVIGVRGSASRTITLTDAGTITVTLTSAGPPADVIVGLGLGIPRSDSVGCNLSQSVETSASASPQLSVPVEVGVYCVRVFDAGGLSGDVSFSVTIVHP